MRKPRSYCTALSLFLIPFLAACGYGARAEEWGNIGVVAFPNELPDYDPSLTGLNEPAVLLNVYETLTFFTKVNERRWSRVIG